MYVKQNITKMTILFLKLYCDIAVQLHINKNCNDEEINDQVIEEANKHKENKIESWYFNPINGNETSQEINIQGKSYAVNENRVSL